jgi:hypothetical protein
MVAFYELFCPTFCTYPAKQGLSLPLSINYTGTSLMEVKQCLI